MFEHLFELIVLFFVIFDPPLSFSVFIAATSNLNDSQRTKIALTAVCVAWIISVIFLLFGMKVLDTFSTNLNDFRVAGGIILALLGLNMAMGASKREIQDGSVQAISSIIATPLLTGPAAITAIIINAKDYGTAVTGVSFTVVLVITGLMLYFAKYLEKVLNKNIMQIISTILGLITLSWGVMFIRLGLGV